VSGGGGDISVPLVLKVRDQDQSFEVSYLPINDKAMDVPQFEVIKNCKN